MCKDGFELLLAFSLETSGSGVKASNRIGGFSYEVFKFVQPGGVWYPWALPRELLKGNVSS